MNTPKSLAKVTIATLLGSLISQSAFAEQYDKANISANVPYEKIQKNMDETDARHQEFQLLETAILQNPYLALDKIISSANSKYTFPVDSDIDTRLYTLGLRYSSTLPLGQLSTIELNGTSNGKPVMTVVAHEKARTNPFVLLEALFTLDQLYSLKNFYGIKQVATYTLPQILGIYNGTTEVKDKNALATIVENVELRANAEAGSLISKRKVAEINNFNFQFVKQSYDSFVPIQKLNENAKKEALIEYAQLKGVSLDKTADYKNMMNSFLAQIDLKNKKQLESLNSAAKKSYKEQIEQYKSQAVERENVVQNKSLSEMVKANDRAGVANAMEVMIPWSLLEPTEKVFWSDYIEAIRHPNYDGASILFRGMDSDEKLQAVTDSKGKVINGGLFSKRLTSGSGSHFYKLKGLPETFERFGTRSTKGKTRISPLNEPHKLTSMLMNHATDPMGSPFISLTYDLNTAFQFGMGATLGVKPGANLEKETAKFLNSNASGGIMTVRIDKRRTISNTLSGFTGEFEVLASMLIFPDEVLYMEKGVEYFAKPSINQEARHTSRMSRQNYYENARSVVYQKTGINLPEDYRTLTLAGKKSYFAGMSELQDRLHRANPNAAPTCSKVFQ